MSTGKEHSLAIMGLLAGSSLGYVSGYVVDPVNFPVIVAGAAFSGYLLTPDIDVDNGSRSNYYIRRIFGTDFLWNIFLYPYRKGKKHRGVSHIPILSTLFRFLYILFPPAIVLFNDQDTPFTTLLFSSLLSLVLSLPLIALTFFILTTYSYEPILYFVIGMFVADIVHISMDRFL